MDLSIINKKLEFIKDYVHINEYMEVLAIQNIYEEEIKKLKKEIAQLKSK